MNKSSVSLAEEIEMGNAPVLLKRERRKKRKKKGDIPANVVVCVVWVT